MDLISHFITKHAGAPCPSCQRVLPALHHFAYAVQSEQAMGPMRGTRDINTDLTLKLAHATPRDAEEP